MMAKKIVGEKCISVVVIVGIVMKVMLGSEW